MRGTLLLRLACITLLTVTTGISLAADIELTGQWSGGQASAISVTDSAIYLGHGSTISVFHTRTFAMISQISLSGYIRNLVISGQYAYVAATEAGLFILDIANPTQIKQVAAVNDVTVLRVVVQGNYAYLAANDAGLRILDISNPAAPKKLIDFKPESWVEGVAVEGRYAWLACNNRGLCVVDVQNPAAPVKLATHAQDYTVYRVFASGGTVFLCGSNDARVTNFNDVSQPKEITTISGSILDVAFQGNIAYVVNSSQSAVDLHDLTDAVLKRLGSIADMYAEAVTVQPGVAYVARYNAGFKAYNVSDPAKPGTYGVWKTDETLEAPFMVGEYMAFPENGTGKVRFYDVKDVLNPQLVTTADIVLDDCVFVPPYLYHTREKLLCTSNLSDIYNPVLESKIALPSKTPYYLLRQGDTLCVWDGMGNYKGFDLFSLADPKNPQKLASITTSKAVEVCGKKGSVVYLKARTNTSSNAGSLVCLDISNPEAPAEGGVMIDSEVVKTFTVHENYGIAWTTQDSVIIFDLSRPLQPKRVSSFYQDLFSIPCFYGDRAYCLGGRMLVYDVSDMTNWRKLSDSYHMEYYTGSLFYPPYIIKPALEGKVYVFDMSGSDKVTPLGEVSVLAVIKQIKAAGSYLYTLDDNATLTRVRCENNTLSLDRARSFRQYGSTTLAGLQIDGDRGYVAEGNYGHMHEIDLRTPELAVLRSWYFGNFQICSFAVVWPYAYIRSNTDFRIYDISNPPQTTLLGSIAGLNGIDSDIFIKGHYAYLDVQKNLYVIDISNPAAPVQAGTFTDNVNIRDMAIAGDHIYLTDVYGGKKIRAVNISNPAAPAAEGIFNDRIYGTAVTTDERYVYVAGGMYGLKMLDFSALMAPTLAAGYYREYLEMYDIAVDRQYIYVLDRYRGVMQFRNNLMSSVNREGSVTPAAFTLRPNYPNPFNAGTTIAFTLPREERVTLSIYNLLGQVVAKPVDRRMEAGVHQVNWQAEGMPSGIYLCEFRAGSCRQMQRMLLLK